MTEPCVWCGELPLEDPVLTETTYRLPTETEIMIWVQAEKKFHGRGALYQIIRDLLEVEMKKAGVLP